MISEKTYIFWENGFQFKYRAAKPHSSKGTCSVVMHRTETIRIVRFPLFFFFFEEISLDFMFWLLEATSKIVSFYLGLTNPGNRRPFKIQMENLVIYWGTTVRQKR